MVAASFSLAADVSMSGGASQSQSLLGREELERLLSLQRATLESTADGILVVDSAGMVVDFNQRLLDIWEISRDVLEGKNYVQALAAVTPLLEDPEECVRTLQQVMASPETESFDVVRFRSGAVLERYSRPQQVSGKTIGRVFSYRNVTARVRAEESCREGEARKSAILESAIDPIVSMDCEGRIREFNRAAEVQFGYRASEAIGKPLAELLVPAALRERHQQGLAHFLATGEGPILGKTCELPAMRADGSEFPAEISITQVRTTGAPFFTGYIHDVSARKRHLERLKALADFSRTLARARLALGAILDITVRSVAETFQEGCFIRIFTKDPTAVQTVAYHHVDPAVQALMERFLSGASLIIDEAAAAQLVRTAKPVSVSVTPEEARARIRPEFRPALERFPLHSWIIVPLMERGQLIGAITAVRHRPGPGYSAEDEAFLVDIAERAALAIDNAKLYAASQEGIRVRDEFMMVASHELRTPLTSLTLQLRSLKSALTRGAGPGQSGEQRMRELVQGSERRVAMLIRLVEELLDVARLSAAGTLRLTLSDVDLSGLLEEVVASLGPELLGARCPVEVSAEPGVVGRWDRVRLEQVVTNLLANAMKFGAGKPIRIAVTREGDRARLVVQDFGIGIAGEHQVRIFERFERAVSARQFSGLGLGLFVAREIVEAHGGRISVRSDPGQGATFTVDLPLERS